MSVYTELVKDTEAARMQLYAVPQLMDGLKGNISRETYLAYLTEAYHHVYHTIPFLMLMGARLPDSKRWLHKTIIAYLQEEVGHEEWILNDISALGGNKEAVRHSIPKLATQTLIAYQYDYLTRKNPVGFLGMVFMLESTSTQIASQGADAVKHTLKLSNNAFSYLYSHGKLDVEHMQFFERTVNHITDEEDKKAISEVAQNSFLLFANLLRSIPHEREVSHAA